MIRSDQLAWIRNSVFNFKVSQSFIFYQVHLLVCTYTIISMYYWYIFIFTVYNESPIRTNSYLVSFGTILFYCTHSLNSSTDFFSSVFWLAIQSILFIGSAGQMNLLRGQSQNLSQVFFLQFSINPQLTVGQSIFFSIRVIFCHFCSLISPLIKKSIDHSFSWPVSIY